MIPKFRVWDNKSRTMHHPDELIIQIRESDILVALEYSLHQVFDYVLMQSTGLTDKNGVEIFDGDILNHQLQGMRKVYYPFRDTVASYGLENIENGMRSTLQDAHRVYEVIGNIYENPELLEEER
ncbi:YopX family protein [Staphylococcus felis]|uniref:YopX family protein n=1 Tax=Staphylococcus felis TaxID=46127 RepID=UPI003966D862